MSTKSALLKYRCSVKRLLFLFDCRFLLLFIGCLLVFFACGKTVSNHESKQSAKHAELTLGHHLFFDKRLSATTTKSCASCHDPRMAFSDGYRKSPGIYGDLHERNTPSILNLKGQRYFNRANTDITTIYDQMEGPLFGHNPIEMGLSLNDPSTINTLSKDILYSQLFQQAFKQDENPVSWMNIRTALTTYVESLTSLNSPYDVYLAGHKKAISASAAAGAKLFFSSKFNCGSCHQPPLMGANLTMGEEQQFANIGLYNYKNGNYPSTDQGLYDVTRKEKDKGRFKVPSLRNLAFTAPYFHDGSTETLEEVLEIYADGGRQVTYGKWQGDGRKNPYKHHLIKKINMSLEEKYQLLDFLQCLNDSTLLTNPHFQNPFSY